MAIVIPHRFIERLLPQEGVRFIDTVIVGTFNPGHPVIERLTDEERKEFDLIHPTKKFQKFNEVRNFYDRPQNRFWKVMDILCNPDYYNNKDLKVKNPEGLKFYSKMDRDHVYNRQVSFCLNRGILITDLVRQIQPRSFVNIYQNFPDKAIETAACVWNTEGILKTIEDYQPKRILINLKMDKSIPNISNEISKIQQNYGSRTYNVLSTSGAAGNTYSDLAKFWGPLIKG
jgi:hypothetical protein